MTVRAFEKGKLGLSGSSGVRRGVYSKLLLALLVIGGSMYCLYGQSTAGTVLGTVKDPVR